MINSLDVNAISTFGIDKTCEMELRRKAAMLFSKALSHGSWRRARARLFGKDNEMRNLAHEDFKIRPMNGNGRLVDAAFDQIVGSESRNADFDKDFYPLKVHLKDRWTNIAAARRRGIVLPPVELIKTAGGFFVRDGHHRILVAKMLGRATIKEWRER